MRQTYDGFLDKQDVYDLKPSIDNFLNAIKDGDGKRLDDIHRVLAFLMRRIRLKENRLFNFKKLSWKNLMRKFCFSKLYDGWWEPNRDFVHDGIFDHCYGEKRKEVDILVSEPYTLYMDEIKRLIVFCEKNKLNFWITGRARHFPNNTLRLNIVRKKSVENKLKTIKGTLQTD